ncbi:immunoglobulin domain-containing protein, partial [Capnocytophaga granulosa]|uniref:immunoglobulin domain-containing protein n=1 Tax=Capnocytophaga granulosa TaxID=45242 RepID=UPI003C769A7E
MKKLNNYKRIWLIVMILSPFFSLVKAQTCDPNILKALEQTRVSVFDKVTKGETGSLFIKYPIDGVTYTFTDQGGTSFSYTHSGGSNSVDVSVGVVNAERKFALKAQKGDCVYQTSFIYKLTPVTTLGISVRVEHEWCNGAGALYYKIVGGDTSKYNFYHRLQGGAYAGLPSPVGGVTTLTSGTYEVKAEPKSGSGAPAVAPVSGLQIKSLKQTVDYTLTDLPSKCTGQLPGLRVNVTSGSYPLLFSLYDNTGTTPVPGFYRQTSNVFTNVPPGNYKVKVEDFCAITGGDATVKGHVVPNTMIDFTETYLNTMQEYGCDYLSFSQLGIKGDNLRPAFEAGSLPFPFTLKFELKEPAPSTTVHTVSRTFNNQNDVSLFLYAHPYVTNLLLVKENLRGERIPKKAGQWEIKAIVSACGTDKTLTAKTVTFKSLFDDFAVYEGGASETTACHSTNIVLSNTTRMDMSIDIYVVVDQAPAGFKYEEAGFFKLTTSNPLLHNKYVKKIHYYGAANNAYPIVAPEYINQGDQFKFRVVDAECDPDRNSGELPLTITHPTNNEPTDLWIHNTQSCRGVTSTGAPYGTFLFSRTRGSEITEIKILSFDGNPSDLPFTLPYTLPISNRINSDTWALYDLPAGKYDISITNRCGNTKLWPNQKLFGETFSFTWSEGCTPSLAAVIGQPEGRAYQSYSVSYFVQHFENGEWKDVERINLNASALSTSYNKTFTETRLKEGKFRVLRKIKYGDNGKICDIVVSEKEYIGDLKNPTAIGAGCPNGKYHIAIIANGGTPPYTYEWVSTTPVGSTTPVPSGHPAQTNDNFFVDLANSDPNTTYTFAVTDACGNRRTVDTSLAGVATPEIKVDAGENAFYCTGQQATLSLPNIKGITVKWYRSDASSTILGTGNSLTITVAPDDFVTGNTYMVELEMPARPDVASCISSAINNNFAYQFKSKNFVTPIPPTRKDITICAENNTTQDLTQLFQNIPTLSPGVTATIREKTGAIYVPDNNTITIGNMKGEYTFVYTLYEPCRKVIGTPVEATLTVNRKINPNTKSNIKICDPSIKMDELKSLVLAGSPEVASLALHFHWYQNNTDAQNQQNESAGSYAISLSPGQKKTVYVRYSKLGYCSGEPKPVEVEREATVAPKALTNPDCSVTTVRTLKALVDPVDSANVIIYKNGTELGDDMLIEEYTPTMYTYSKRLFQCTPPAQALTFSFNERTAAAPQQVGVCTFPGYQNAPTVKVADIKSKIQAQYVGKTIRIYQNNSELSAANATVYFTATDVYFTVEESGKCPSLQQKVTLQQAPFSVATLLPALSICEDTTIAELKAEIGAQGLSNVRIYSSSLATEESDDKFVVWGNPYYYRVVETGKCPSDLIPLTFTNKGNKTDATPRRFEVCIAQSATARVSDLKAIITGGDVRIFKRNNDNTWSAPLTDNEAVNENDAYFYTLRASGKCPSDKTPLILAITRKTPTPTAPADPMWCSGKKVSDLKTYIASKGVTGTIKIYESATATTDLADATVLEKNKSYHFTTHDGNPQHCESNPVALTVTIYASPTITTQPVASSTLCGGSRPTTLSVVATGDDISYQWYKNTTNDNTSGDIIPGKTSATFDPPTDTVVTTYYYVKVSSGKGCAAAVSNTAKVLVTKPTKITRQPSNIRHCMGTLPPPNRLEVDAEGTGTLTYQWYLKNNNYPSGTTVPNVPGNTGQDFFYNPPIDSPDATTYYVEVTSDCGTVKSNEIVVDIIPYPSFKSGGNLTTNDDATYCKGSTSVHKLKVDVQQGAGSPVYQWYKATSPMGTGQEIARAWSNEYTPDVSESGTFYYYVTVRNQQYCTEELTSYKAKIVVNETTAIEDDLSETEVKYCKGATPTALTVKMKGTPNYTYTWYKASNMTETGTVVRTQTSATAVQDSYTPATADEGTFYYYVKVHSSCGDDKTSKRAKITVTKDTAIKTDGNLSTTEVKYCKNTTATALTVKVEGTAPYTYKWYKADSATATGTLIRTENTNSDEDSYTPVVTTVGTTYYYVEVSSACGSEETSARAHITVQDITTKPTPTAVNLCQGATVANLKAQLALTLTGTLKVYATATDPADLADTTVLNATTYYYTATETNKCESDRQAMAVTLVQAPTAQATYTYCVGTTVDTLWKAIDANDSDNSIRIYNVATGGTPLTRTDLLTTTTYYVAETASNGGVVTCETSRVPTQVTIGSVANPVIATTPATCGVATVVKITNHVPGINYTITDSANATVAGASVAADGTIGGITSAGTYKIKATQGTCVSGEETFTIAEALPIPETPTVMVAPPTCTAMSVAKVSNYTDYTHGETFAITDSNGTAIGAVDNTTGNITGLTTAGTYTLTITRGTCRAAAVDFDIADKLPTPAKPEITLTPASCTSPTVAKLTQVSGLTFWHNGTQLTVNPITHEIMGLAPGTYTITAKNNNNCESVASDSFEIKAQKAATTITTHPAGATYQKGTEATPLAVVATGEGTLSYKWYKNTDNNNTSGTEVGDNSPSYKPATDTVGSFYYWVEVTSNCGAVKSDVAEIKVVQGAPTIEANDDPDTTVRRGQEVAVLGNDKVNGNPATPADVDITISNDGGLTRVGVNPATGKIMIPNDAVPATYEITYKICVKNQPTICDEAKVKITVEVPALALKAVDDDFGKIPNTVDYTTVATVFSSGVDTMEGVVGNLSPERDVVLTPGAQPHENITMNPNGSITVKRGTPKGTYTYEYTICQKDVPTNCDKAKVSFEVIEAHIFAKDDGVWEVGTEGALTPSVLNNDILGERVGIAPSEVSITKTNGKPVIDDTKMVMNEDGRISVKKGIAEGTYTYYYTITEKANTANTSSASVTIRVVSFSAQDDEFNITNDKTKEFKTESVLANDELNKKKNPSPVDDVILTIGEAKDAERNPTTALTMNDDGTITIAPNTPDGVYTYTYTICKTSAPTECKS